MSSIPVKFLHTQLPGLTPNTNVLGSFIKQFDAFLSDGFNEQTITSGEIKDNVLTFSHLENKGYGYNTVVKISENSIIPEGEYRVTGFSRTTTSIKLNNVSNQSVGSFKIMAAPLGWTKHVISTNERVYTPANASFDHSFYIKDDSAAFLEVAIVRYTSGNIEKIFPRVTYSDYSSSSSQNISHWYSASKVYFNKTEPNTIQSNIIRSFTLIGDSKSFYYCPSFYNSSTTANYAYELNTGSVYFYGEMQGIDSDEKYTGLFCDINNTSKPILDVGHLVEPSVSNSYDLLRASCFGLVSNFGYKDRVQFSYVGSDGVGYIYSNKIVTPNTYGSFTNKIPVARFYAFNYNDNSLLAKLPGMYYYGKTINDSSFSNLAFQFFKGKGNLKDRLLLLKTNTRYSSNYGQSNGRIQKLFDIEGPWDS